MSHNMVESACRNGNTEALEYLIRAFKLTRDEAILNYENTFIGIGEYGYLGVLKYLTKTFKLIFCDINICQVFVSALIFTKDYNFEVFKYLNF